MHREVTPLRSYEGFATDLNKKLSGNDTVFEDLPTVPKAGLFYWITFTIEYPGKIGVPVARCPLDHWMRKCRRVQPTNQN